MKAAGAYPVSGRAFWRAWKWRFANEMQNIITIWTEVAYGACARMSPPIPPGIGNPDTGSVTGRALRAFIAGFAVAFVSLSCYNVLADSYDVTFQETYSYRVTIGANGDGPYVLLVPCAVDSDGGANPELMGGLGIAGNCTTTVVTTEKGPMLGISGRGDVQLSSGAEFDSGKGRSPRGGFSPRLSSAHNASGNGRTIRGWVDLSENSGILTVIVRVELVCEEGTSFYNGLGQGGPNSGHVISSRLEGPASDGWTELPMKNQRMEWDAFVGWRFFSPLSLLFTASVSGIFGSTAAMWYLARFRKKNPSVELRWRLDVIFARLAAIFALVSIMELFSAPPGQTMYLGQPSVMNVLQVSRGNRIQPILMVYSATLYALLLQSVHQARTGKRRAVALCAGFGAWLPTGFYLWLASDEEPFQLLAGIALAMSLLALLSVIVHLKTARPEMRQIEQGQRYAAAKRITWVHFGDFLGDTGYFVRVGEDTYKLSAEKAFDFSRGQIVTVVTDGTGKVRSIGGIAPLKWP